MCEQKVQWVKVRENNDHERTTDKRDGGEGKDGGKEKIMAWKEGCERTGEVGRGREQG